MENRGDSIANGPGFPPVLAKDWQFIQVRDAQVQSSFLDRL